MLVVGIIGWTGSQISKNVRLVFQAMTLFFVCFGFWYLWQSIFAIGSMCIYCIGCYGAVLAISFAWLRLNHSDLPISKKALKFIDKIIAKNQDWIIWAAIAALVLFELIIKFV